METNGELYVTYREDWHAWLEQNYETEKKVWLIFYKKHTGKPSINYEDSVEEALCFGWIDSLVRKIDDEKFARKFTPRKNKSSWSELNKKRAVKMMKEGKMTKLGLKKIEQAKKNGEWLKTRHRTELVTPPFMQEALASNEKAQNNFNKLAPSYKRQYIGWISSSKKEETRKRRLQESIKLLEKNEKLPMK